MYDNVKRLFIVFLILLALSATFFSCSYEKSDESTKINNVVNGEYFIKNNQTESELSFEFFDVNLFEDYLYKGVYRCGTDFVEGDYFIFSLYSAHANFHISDDPNNFVWSDYHILKKVTLKNGQYVKLTSAILIPCSYLDTNKLSQYGIFKVGVDLPEGEYKVTQITNEYNSRLENIINIDGAYQVTNSLDSEPISCKTLYEEQNYVSVKNGQYLIINNATITSVNSLEDTDTNGNSTIKIDTTATTTTTSFNKITAVESAFIDATTATKIDLTKKNGHYFYRGMKLVDEDNEWIDDPLNGKGEVNQGSLYRSIAEILWGSEYEDGKTMYYDYKDISEMLLGFAPETLTEYLPYAKNAREFITIDNELQNIMKKFEKLECVSGEFDFEYKSFGKFDILISDVTACANEMQISEEMLGYVLARLTEYAPKITFDNKTCHIEYKAY